MKCPARKTIHRALALGLTLTLVPAAGVAQVPNLMTFQGRVQTGGTNFNGMGQFKFALVDAAGPAVTSFWSNDGTSMNGDEPAAHVTAPVEDGLFTVELGQGLFPLGPSIFTNVMLHLRVWFNDGVAGFQQLAPDQRLATSPYAMISALVEDGSITGAKLAPGAVETIHLASNAVVTASISDHLALGSAATHGSLSVFHNDQGGRSLWLDGETVRISAFGDGDRERFNLTGLSYGRLALFNHTNVNPTVVLTGLNEAAPAPDEGVGALYLNATDGTRRARLVGLQTGGRVELFGSDQTPSPLAVLASGLNPLSAPGGLLQLRNQDGQLRFEALSEPSQLRLLQFGNSVGLELATDNVGGQLRTYDAAGNLTSSTGSGNSGGGATYFQADDSPGVGIDGLDTPGGGGVITVYRASGGAGVHLDGERASDGGGEVSVFNAAGHKTVEMVGQEAGSLGGKVLLRGSSGVDTVEIDAQEGAAGGSLMRLHNPNGASITLDSENDAGASEISLSADSGIETVSITGAEAGSAGGQILLKRTGFLTNVTTVEIDGRKGGSGGSIMRLHKADGSSAIVLDSEDSDGNGRVVTEVLEITGGSDLSEQFDIAPLAEEVKAGMVVCIDPDNPGRLVPSARAYDRTVAGVVSGAGGVRPGMLMGQAGSVADGKHPVALTGRVFCLVDAAYGAVRPGDMISTSDTPGHGMVVSRHEEARGAILGKAMTSLREGKGLVLVLVSLQ